MDDFAESLRAINELAHMDEGYEDVKAVVIEGECDLETDETVTGFREKGYRIIDENMFGMGGQCLGRVVVFAKGEKTEE